MKDLISRSAIKYEQWSVGPLCEPLMVVRKKTIDSIPAVDAVEVVHGRWEMTADGAAKCTACGRKMNPSQYGYPHCSLCGARMDGE